MPRANGGVAAGSKDVRRWSWDVLAHRDLRWYLAGNVCSNLGTWLQNTAQILLAYSLTDSVLGVGLVTGAQFAGALLLAPWAGVIADRFDRRRVLIGTHLVSAAVAAAMAVLHWAGALRLGVLVVGALAIGIAYTFTLPALSAFVPTLVPPDRTRAAMALNAVSFNVGRALAPLLSVGVISVLGYAWAFLLNAVSFVLLAVVFAELRPRAARRDGQTPRLLDGLRIAWSDRRILAGLFLVSLVTVATDPPLVLGPSLALEVFGVDVTWSAYFMAAFGLGTLVGSLVPTGLATLRGTAKCLGVVGGAIAVLAVLGPGRLWLGVAAVAVAGLASLIAGAGAQTLLLTRAGPARAGRVMAVWAVAFAGSRPVATAIDTWLAGSLGPRSAAFILAVPAVLVALVAPWLRLSRTGHLSWRVPDIVDSVASRLPRARKGPLWRVPAGELGTVSAGK